MTAELAPATAAEVVVGLTTVLEREARGVVDAAGAVVVA